MIYTICTYIYICIYTFTLPFAFTFADCHRHLSAVSEAGHKCSDWSHCVHTHNDPAAVSHREGDV